VHDTGYRIQKVQGAKGTRSTTQHTRPRRIAPAAPPHADCAGTVSAQTAGRGVWGPRADTARASRRRPRLRSDRDWSDRGWSDRASRRRLRLPVSTPTPESPHASYGPRGEERHGAGPSPDATAGGYPGRRGGRAQTHGGGLSPRCVGLNDLAAAPPPLYDALYKRVIKRFINYKAHGGPARTASCLEGVLLCVARSPGIDESGHGRVLRPAC
jgi:hypothetical protein